MVRRSRRADQDLAGIALWTADRFGEAQAQAYGRMIERAFARLAAEPLPGVSRSRPELGEGVRALHLATVAKRRSAARHIIFYRIDVHGVGVARILHESMDPMLADMPEPS